MPGDNTPTLDPKSELIVKLGTNPRLAHQSLFEHRHPQQTPPFHYEIIDLWHSSHPRVLVQAFRGAGKSTIAEEAIVVQACLKKFRNGIILGETYERAVERLRAIKHEFETNSVIESLFGNLVGGTWTEGKIILANGVIIQAFGRGQSLRGSKHLDFRPDRAFADDIENEDSCATAEAIEKCKRWFVSVVIPALDTSALVRINGTPLHPNSVIVQLQHDPGWVSRVYPIETINPENGERVPTWPSRFDLDWISTQRSSFDRLGAHDNFQQEYMCKAEDPARKAFKPDMFRAGTIVRSWEAVYAMYDPARTVRATSAGTGVAIWSWVGSKLIVWDAYAGYWRPDEIISDMFKVDEIYKPVCIGVERDGLEEFIMQPLRHEQVRRSHALPIRAVKAPTGKLDFIRSLQPFFNAGEVVFAKSLPDLEAQLLGFPSGKIDIPNALAYALRMRGGTPVYDNFGFSNVAEQIPVVGSKPCYVALNTDGSCTSAVLLQVVDGAVHVLADSVREGDPGASLAGMLADLGIIAGSTPRLFAGLAHFSDYDTLGLRAAVRAIPGQVNRGGAENAGREQIRALLSRQMRNLPALRVSREARWTLNAFAGGYYREVNRDGTLAAEPAEGAYKVLMQGLESFVALMQAPMLRDDQPVNWAVTRDGRRYISSLPNAGSY